MGAGTSRSVLSIAAVLAMAIAFPLLVQSNYVLTLAINAIFFTILGMSLNIIYGYGGLLSFAQVAFWGIGGYASALTVLKLGGSMWEGAVLGVVLNCIIAVFIGFVSLRLSTHAFVIVSIAFTLLVQMLSQEWIWLTNGPMGLPGLPAPSVSLGFLEWTIDSRRDFYFLALMFSVTSLAIIYLVVSSRVGETLKMIRYDETLARSMGIRTTAWKLFAAALSAAFASLAGSFYVFFLSIVDPLIFDIFFTQLMLVIVIVGGLGSFWPVVFAGIALTLLPEFLRTPNEIRMILYGFILIGTIVVFPKGIAGLIQVAARRGRAVRGS